MVCLSKEDYIKQQRKKVPELNIKLSFPVEASLRRCPYDWRCYPLCPNFPD
jgi:hypothetical protein